MIFRGRNLISRVKSAGVLAFVLPFVLLAVTLATAAMPHRAAAAPQPPVGVFSTLYSFCSQNSCLDGSEPFSGVVVNGNGTIFGNTCIGGTNGDGVIFSLNKNGAEKVLTNLSTATGGCPYFAALLPNGPHEFFGTSYYGGANDCGTVFKLVNDNGKWKLTVLYSFQDTNDGCYPYSGLVMDKKGNLYGTTYYGNSGDYSGDGYGTVFELSPPAKSGGAWTETLLYSFCSQTDCVDGDLPTGSLIIDKTGTLYGTTYEGGSMNSGTIFAIPPYGGEAVLYSFCQQVQCYDGAKPFGVTLAMDKSGNLFGTTYEGGNENAGTVFELTKTGTYSVLYNFCSQSDCVDGAYPHAGVILDKSGNLFGTTYEGGSAGYGTVFEILHDTGEAVLHSFTDTGTDGAYPEAGLTMDAKGNLYGTTYEGGTDNSGTVFVIKP